jgi:hypothetical protein
MNKRIIYAIAAGVAAAIVALLAYSLDRTAWLFTLYEGTTPNAADLGWAAALVVELAVVALVAGDGAAEALELDKTARERLRSWAGRGLAAVLLVQVLANLLAGYLRGAGELARLLGATSGPAGWAAFAIGAVVWAATNALAPLLIFYLAKVEAQLVRLLILAPAAGPVPVALEVRDEPALEALPAPALSLARVEAQPVYPPAEEVRAPGDDRLADPFAPDAHDLAALEAALESTIAEINANPAAPPDLPRCACGCGEVLTALDLARGRAFKRRHEGRA